MNRDKQKDALKKERAKRKLQEIKEREKQEEEGTRYQHHPTLSLSFFF